MTRPQKKLPKATIGWREWVALPGLGIAAIKAKIDTGARSSSLHAFDVEAFDRDGSPWVRFVVHPWQRDCETALHAEAPVLEFRQVRSSSGHLSLRPVVRVEVLLSGVGRTIDLTLAARDEMGFRMLLGREAVRGRFVVDPGRSFVVSTAPASSAPLKRAARRTAKPAARPPKSTQQPIEPTTKRTPTRRKRSIE